MSKVKKTIIILIILFAVIGLVVFSLSPVFDIKEITVQGNSNVSKTEILQVSGVKEGDNIIWLNTGKIKKYIEDISYIKTAEIKRSIPMTLVITVEEREIAYLIEKGTEYAYIDSQGYILEVSSEKPENVPIIQEQDTKVDELIEGARLNSADLKKLNTVLKIMEIAKNNEINNLITRIGIESANNYTIVLESKGITAHLGNCSDLSTRILELKAILEKVEGKQGDIFIDMDLNEEDSYPYFREKV